MRTAERGRDEFNGSGDSAALDLGRAAEAGRHYGRSGPTEPEVEPPPTAESPVGTVTFPPEYREADGEVAAPAPKYAPVVVTGRPRAGSTKARKR